MRSFAERRFPVRGLVMGTVGVLLLAGCTVEDPTPTPTPVPPPVSSTASAGAELVCGVDKADIELVTGNPVSRWDGDLVVHDGIGSGRCEAFSDAAGGQVFVVELAPATSDEAKHRRDLVDGLVGNPASLVYDPAVADGAVWGSGDGPGARPVVATNSSVFWGQTLIYVYVSPLAPWRDGPADHLALTEQIAATYSLQRPTPTPIPTPPPTPPSVPSTASAGAELVCGVDKADIELVTGSPVSRWEGDLLVHDGIGSGRCEVFSDARDWQVFVVELTPVTAEEAQLKHAEMDGWVGDPPSLVYDPSQADGAIWGSRDNPGPRLTATTNSSIFWGPTLIDVYVRPLDTWRDGPADHLALTSQIARTYGLQRPTP